MTEQKPKISARIHPDDQTKIAVLNQAATLFHGTPLEKSSISYYTPELIQCTLPHSPPKTNPWIKKNGNYTLIIATGYDENGEPFGIPYGSLPRLVLAYIITHVLQTGERRVNFESYFMSFLKEVGYDYKPSTRNAKSLREGLERLLHAMISFDYKDDEGRTRLNMVVAPKSALWWNFKEPQQGSFWSSYIEISEDFYDAIMRSPVPLVTEMLSALKRSPLALDVYMWVSYRLFTMQEKQQQELTLSYGSLQAQFGSGIAQENYRNFRFELKKALGKVKEAWEEVSEKQGKKLTLHYDDTHETTLTLFRSPLLIAKPAAAPQHEAQRFISSRRFDDATRKKARQLAGTKWSVDYLEKQYFDWIEQAGIIPKSPIAHFLDFITEHRNRND